MLYPSSDDTLRQNFSGLCMEIVFGVEFFFVVSCQHSRSYGILSILNFVLCWHNLYWNWAVGIAQRQTILIVCEAAQCWNNSKINPCVPCSTYPSPIYVQREGPCKRTLLLSSVFLLLLDSVRSLRNTVYTFLSMLSKAQHWGSPGNLLIVLLGPA